MADDEAVKWLIQEGGVPAGVAREAVETVTGGRLGTSDATAALERWREELDERTGHAVNMAGVGDALFREMVASPTKTIRITSADAALKRDEIGALLASNVLTLRDSCPRETTLGS